MKISSKFICKLLLCSFLINSCATHAPSPERIKFNFYMRDWDATNGAAIGSERFYYGKRFSKAYYRLDESLNFHMDQIPEKHLSTPKGVLSAYLSVWNPLLYRSLFISNPKEQFDNQYINSFRRYPPAKKKEDRPERLKIIMEHKFDVDSTDYYFSKDTLYKFTGEQEVKCFCLQKEGNRWYFNDSPKQEIASFFDLFCNMKFDVAKIFVNARRKPRSYPGYDLEEPIPTSGNKYLDQEIKQIYIATHTHQLFNVDKFIQLKSQWEKEGKTGILNYFFEN